MHHARTAAHGLVVKDKLLCPPAPHAVWTMRVRTDNADLVGLGFEHVSLGRIHFQAADGAPAPPRAEPSQEALAGAADKAYQRTTLAMTSSALSVSLIWMPVQTLDGSGDRPPAHRCTWSDHRRY